MTYREELKNSIIAKESAVAANPASASPVPAAPSPAAAPAPVVTEEIPSHEAGNGEPNAPSVAAPGAAVKPNDEGGDLSAAGKPAGPNGLPIWKTRSETEAVIHSFNRKRKRERERYEKELSAMRKEIDGLKNGGKGSEEELTREDFSSQNEYDNYRVQTAVKQQMEAWRTSLDADAQSTEQERTRTSTIEQRIQQNFPTEAAMQDYRDTVQAFVQNGGDEDLGSEEGQAITKELDNYVTGPRIFYGLCKRPDILEKLIDMPEDRRKWEIANIDRAVRAKLFEINQQRAANGEAPMPGSSPAAAQPGKGKIPTTGKFNTSASAKGKFDAKATLRQLHPERYR